MRFYITSLIVLITTIICSSCTRVKDADITPRFLQIDSVQLANVDYTKHGAVSHKITDVWVYANNDLIGAYELPAKVPILGTAVKNITLLAGVQRNGISTDRVKYNFYDTYELNADWQPGTNKTIAPIFNYLPPIRMEMLMNEDFELGNSFTPANFKDTAIIKTSNTAQVKYGNYCGYIPLDSTHAEANNIITTPITLIPGEPYYIEIDYKSDMPIIVQLFCKYNNGQNAIKPLSGINPKATWNKIYLDLGAMASVEKAAEYNLIISVLKPTNAYTSYAFIDNIKILGPKK